MTLNERKAMKQNAVRWALVTFCTGITCGVLGTFVPRPESAMIFSLIALGMSAMGCLAVEDQK